MKNSMMITLGVFLGLIVIPFIPNQQPDKKEVCEFRWIVIKRCFRKNGRGGCVVTPHRIEVCSKEKNPIEEVEVKQDPFNFLNTFPY